MRWIVAHSLRFRWLVLFAAAALTAYGVAQIPHAKVDVFPEFAPPRVEIQTIALGNASQEVEELITVPIENQLNGLPGLDEMRSKSVAQLSSIQLIFERGTDELRVRQLVQERLAQITATLPTWASPPWMMPPVSATSRVMKIGVSSDRHSLIELSSLAYWKINQRLNIRNVQPIQSAEDLGKVPVVQRNGKVLRLSDLGVVKTDHLSLIHI